MLLSSGGLSFRANRFIAQTLINQTQLSHSMKKKTFANIIAAGLKVGEGETSGEPTVDSQLHSRSRRLEKERSETPTQPRQPKFGSCVLQQRGGAVTGDKNCNFLSSFLAAAAAAAASGSVSVAYPVQKIAWYTMAAAAAAAQGKRSTRVANSSCRV